MSTISDRSETIYIGCECHVPEHIVKVSYFDWDHKDEPELYFELQADRHMGFWRRLQLGLKFIFGSSNLEWHDVIPNINDVTKLNRLLTKYIDAYNTYYKDSK
jgi:hypothetical protein